MGKRVHVTHEIRISGITVNSLLLARIGFAIAITFGGITIDLTWAIDTSEPLADPQQQTTYEEIINEVRCLVCQNQTIADSMAPLAADLRREIRAMVKKGNSEQDIKDFLIERYGDFVLYRPRVRSWTLALWLAPFVFLVVGGATLLRIVRHRESLPIDQDAELAEE